MVVVKNTMTDCLILNLDYSPFDIWEWKHAISKLLCTNSVNMIYNDNGAIIYDKIIRDGKGNEYELPAVLILSYYISVHTGMAPYTKYNIYARDLGICQYCGNDIQRGKHTIDHVIPRAHWNPRRFNFKLSSFENVVTSCGTCNKQKRNRTPKQAGMTLIRQPKRISRVRAYTNKLAMIHNKPIQWIPYLNV
jgi:5-methylcytosine-specific restriction endonuclease McrA